jgi:hypothetical protein
LVDRVRGYTELRIDDATLRLLVVRQIELVQALLRRGHASQDKIRLKVLTADRNITWRIQKLPPVLEEARVHPEWSGLADAELVEIVYESGRLAAKDELAELIATDLQEAAGESITITHN